MSNKRSLILPQDAASRRNDASMLVKQRKSNSQFLRLCFQLLVMVLLVYPSVAASESGGNCLLCHKVEGLVVASKDGKSIRNMTIDEELYKASYHGRVGCKGCHSDIKKIPHGEAKKVNCANDCHIRDPSTNGKYSHARVAKNLAASAHGVKQSPGAVVEDFPDCKNCHENKPYQKKKEDESHFKEFQRVCLQCHESAAWIERFYKHMNYRTSIRRSSKDIVRLCSQCHADGAMMGRHDLEVVIGFNDTFHGKAIQYGNTEVANCLNCHAPYVEGFSPHSIISRKVADSPVSPDNKIVTCRQAGCHVDANEAFASSGKVHPSSYGMVSWLRPKQTTIESLRSDQYESNFQKLVIYAINLFYKVLIALVVGGLGTHQLLAYLAFRRERKAGEEQA